jgi:hypothetical protein
VIIARNTQICCVGRILKSYNVNATFSFLTNECTFYFRILFNSPYICFGRDLAIISGTLIRSLHCSLVHLVLSQNRYTVWGYSFTLTITGMQSMPEHTACFINPSGISEVCSSGAKSHTGGWEHVSEKSTYLSFEPTLQVFNMSLFGDSTDVNPVI